MIDNSHRIKYLLLFILSFFVQFIPAKEKESPEKETEQTRKEYINHHILDSHDLSLFHYVDSDGKTHHIGFPLPVILWDNGLTVFSSSRFYHGKHVVKSEEAYYTLYHGKIYKTNVEGKINFDAHHHPTNKKPLDFSITKNVVTILFISLLMLLIFGSLARSYRKSKTMLPTGVGRFFEPIVVYIRDEIAIPSIGKKHYKHYMSFLLTVFFFIWSLNLLGLTPSGANITGNITITFALALVTFIITNISGNKNYWLHIFWMPGVPILIKVLLAPIEFLGIFIKPFALMMRLFANIMAGHVVLMSVIALIFLFKNWVGGGLSFTLAFFISILELLVALLQAYIFTLLSALYFGMAVEEPEKGH